MKALICWHGAVESAYRKLFDEIANLGVEVSLIAPSEWTEGGRRQRLTPGAAGYDITVLRAAFKDHIRAFFYPNVPGIIRKASVFRPDIIHVMEEPFSLAAYEFLRIKKLFARPAKTILYSFENIDIRQRFPYSVFQSYNLDNADAIVVVPEESMPLWRKRGFRGKISTIGLGVDSGFYRKVPKERAFEALKTGPNDIFTVGYAGRVVKEKGIETLVEAQGILKKDNLTCRLLIAGSGDDKYKSSLIKRSADLGVGGLISYLGPLSQKDLPYFYSAIDALTLASLTTPGWKEQFGRTLIEAMACETPVIGSSSGEIPNVIGEAGLVFKEGDATELAERIKRLMTDVVLRKGLSRKGLERARDEFSWKAIAGKYVKLYGELLNNRG